MLDGTLSPEEIRWHLGVNGEGFLDGLREMPWSVVHKEFKIDERITQLNMRRAPQRDAGTGDAGGDFATVSGE